MRLLLPLLGFLCLLSCIKYANKANIQNSIDYIAASITYAKKYAKNNFNKYLKDTLINGWAEVETKKTQTQRSIKEEEISILKKAAEKTAR